MSFTTYDRMLTLPAFQLIELRTSSLKYYACFIALLDVFLSENITFSYAGKNLFLINTQSTVFKHTGL